MKTMFLAIFLLSFSGKSIGVDFFSQPIDYWNKGSKEPKEKEAPKAVSAPSPPIPKPAETTAPVPFEWEKHANPKNDEFFKEGDYTPPKAFMELARNPNDENIKRWFEMIETKNQLLRNLQDRIASYLQKSGSKISNDERALLEEKRVALEPDSLDKKRFRFRMYFDSNCPHCKQMMATMQDLQSLGFYTEVRQIDKNNPNFPVPFPIVHATKEEIIEKNITSWPVLFVADVEKQLVYRINGFFPTREVLATLAKK